MATKKDIKTLSKAQYSLLRTKTLRQVAKADAEATAARQIGRLLDNLDEKHGTNQTPIKKG